MLTQRYSIPATGIICSRSLSIPHAAKLSIFTNHAKQIGAMMRQFILFLPSAILAADMGYGSCALMTVEEVGTPNVIPRIRTTSLLAM